MDVTNKLYYNNIYKYIRYIHIYRYIYQIKIFKTNKLNKVN